jgi:hypothetical protein
VIVLTLVLLGFAVADLIRWSPEPVSWQRSSLAGLGAVIATVALADGVGYDRGEAVRVGLLTAAPALVWLASELLVFVRDRPGIPLAWMLVSLGGAALLSTEGNEAAGRLERWYFDSPLEFTHEVPLDQFLLGVAAGLFLLATANRVVRLVLDAAGTPASQGEATLRGGRLLGPMERVFVAAMILAGEPTAAAIIIAAKGLLRLPEMRASEAHRTGSPGHITQYFLVETFSSLLLAGAAAGLVLAAS